MWGRLRIILLIGTVILWAFFGYVVIDSSIIPSTQRTNSRLRSCVWDFHLSKCQFHLSGSAPKEMNCTSSVDDNGCAEEGREQIEPSELHLVPSSDTKHRTNQTRH